MYILVGRGDEHMLFVVSALWVALIVWSITHVFVYKFLFKRCGWGMRYYIVTEYDEDSGDPDERYIVVKSDDYDMMKDYHYRCYHHYVLDITDDINKDGEYKIG